MARRCVAVTVAVLCIGATVSAQFGGFEVASVKPSDPNSTGPVGLVTPAFGRVTASNATLRRLVYAAYRLQPFQVVGGPSWQNTARFDIDARAGDGAVPTDLLLDLLKSLLADRFQLKVHTETREMPIFELTVSRGDGRTGDKLRPSAAVCPELAEQEQRRAETVAKGGVAALQPRPGDAQPCSITLLPSTSTPGALALQATGQTMQGLSVALTQLMGRSVVDKTGLAGRFDFGLLVDLQTLAQLSADLGDNPRPLPLGTPGAPALGTQLREELGLKLDSRRGPVEVLVIDSAERPMPN